MMEEETIDFKDFDIRYQMIREKYPDIGNCAFRGCKNPPDDTVCSYHRLLFDHWMYEVKRSGIVIMSPRGRRIAFSRWANKKGKEVCDTIVLDMAQDLINWVC